MIDFETICALATPNGEGAISIIRLSGNDAISIANKIFYTKKDNNNLLNVPSHKVVFGQIINNGRLIDECLCTVFKSPHSYTGEDSVEFSIHGSPFIAQETLIALIENGAKPADRGEFTKRAFFNGKLNLAQAEAVCDIISSHNETSHTLALKQLRGGYNYTLLLLRQKLIDVSSLLELELDFSEQDVEFANREYLNNLLEEINIKVKSLINSFSLGNCFKNGIPVTIVGKPNSGKSTLLNSLLNEERAIVSEEEGTTRDTIEATLNLNGLEFRFIDTAGIRNSNNTIEKEGIKRTFKAIENSKIILLMVDMSKYSPNDAKEEIEKIKQEIDFSEKELILIGNKIDKIKIRDKGWDNVNAIKISASAKTNIGEIVDKMLSIINPNELRDKVFVSNIRHYEALLKVSENIDSVRQDILEDIPSDLIATSLRNALHHLGTITGEVTTNEILGNIFSKFCIGK